MKTKCVNARQAAELCGLSAWTLRSLARKGKLPASREEGQRDWEFPEAAILALRSNRRMRGANAPMRELIKRGLVS